MDEHCRRTLSLQKPHKKKKNKEKGRGSVEFFQSLDQKSDKSQIVDNTIMLNIRVGD